ncbi:class I SAM-dependent methyltransferase [Pararhodospirillum oryzae]|uniref:Methyltransferase type 11 domain-containing protein n=1 Tax=Pararhodospirillum oryzae TaxID=478448 RepID=A0A512H7N7_9PROT|nr:methyltransferase domain-containing protein [Pararhodospirillum oryzae]GEO81444.1 hypothetical protein ROR02_15750 [Pararhodospirillum oryzae]
MRLNLGCGGHHREGWINVDRAAALAPDQVVDLETTPWPWPDDSVDEILLSHVLEHLGETPRAFLAVMGELWRVCRNGARITIVVPHPRHDSFLNDPTHVRPITPEGLVLFDHARNLAWQAEGIGNSPLGLILGIDLEVTGLAHDLEEPWLSQAQAGTLDRAALIAAEKQFNNVIRQTTLEIRVHKPVRRG